MLIVYSTPVCGKCKILKNKLTRAGVAFKDINLWEDEEAATFIATQPLKTLPLVYKEVSDELVFVGTDVEV